MNRKNHRSIIILIFYDKIQFLDKMYETITYNLYVSIYKMKKITSSERKYKKRLSVIPD